VAFLVEIKKKIEAVQNTRKITKAMELVAASRMRTFQRKALGARTYAWGLLREFLPHQANVEELPWGEIRDPSLPTLFVIITSDKGLCGSLNQQLLRHLWRSEEWNALPPEKRLLITIGRKSAEAAQYAGFPPVKKFEGIREALDPLSSLKLIEKIVGFWTRKECREIILISPHYVNPFVFYPTTKRYLPFSPSMVESHLGWKDPESMVGVPLLAQPKHPMLEEDTAPVLLEPSREEVMDAFVRQLVQSVFLQAFYELKACEYSSRMVAMKNATEAADKRLQEFTHEYHKVRQGAITQQLAELAGGTAAID
jgi:F-type H+-transporting ATPase subunit gamma